MAKHPSSRWTSAWFEESLVRITNKIIQFLRQKPKQLAFGGKKQFQLVPLQQPKSLFRTVTSKKKMEMGKFLGSFNKSVDKKTE